MSNPFQPPVTQITDGDGATAGAAVEFYTVAKPKFFTLYIASMGLFAVYWSYKNWSLIKSRTGLKCWPVMRGLFLVFFVHRLAETVQQEADQRSVTVPFSLKNLASILVVLFVVNHLLDRLTAKSIGEPYLDVLTIGLVILQAFMIWQFQQVINRVSGDAEGSGNARFTGGNIVLVVLGMILWGFSIYGLFFPEG